MKILKEFRDFAMRGNVVDMAVGVVIGAAFGKIVTSLVSDIIMPPLGLAAGEVDFSTKKLIVQHATDAIVNTNAAGIITTNAPARAEIALNYGQFFNNIISFVIVAFALFIVIQAMNKLKKKQEKAPEPAAMPADVALLTEIRDLLKKK